MPGQFNSPPIKKLRVEVEKEETKVGEASGGNQSLWIHHQGLHRSAPEFHVIWVFLLITCHTGSLSKRRGPRGVVNQFPSTAACFVTTGHRTGLPPSPIPVITLM